MTGFNERAYRLDAWWRRTLRRRLLLVPWYRYQWRRSRLAYIPAFIRCADREHPLRIALDLLLLVCRWRCVPVHYFRYALYRSAHGRSSMLSYLPETVLYYRLLPRASADEILLDDKSLTKAVLAEIGVRTPQTVGVVHDGQVRWMADPAAEMDLVLKPARHSSGGDGVQLVRRSGRDLVAIDAVCERVHTAWLKGDWLIAQRIRSSPELAHWNEETLNTLRIYTLAGPCGAPQILGAVLKTGSGSAIADNAHLGGI